MDSIISKLLGMLTVGSTLASVGILHRLLSGIATVVMLAIVSAFMLCGLLAGGFCMAYACLLHYGIDSYMAGMIVGGVALLLTALLVTFTIIKIRQLRELPHRSGPANRSGLPDVGHIANAFIDGFLNPGR